MVSFWSTLLFVGGSRIAFGAVAGARMQRRDATPQLPYDQATTSECTWWHDQTTALSCDTILSVNAISVDQFRRWNPTIGAGCAGLMAGRSYCVEAAFESLPTISPPVFSTAISSTSAATPSSTTPSNGIKTPSPIQPGLVSNCDAFYFVQKEEGCAYIAHKHGITLAQFEEWNPRSGSNCAGLWAETYACVSIVGHTAITPTPTPTKVSNGIQTPQPTQPGMVTNCNKFHWIAKNVVCGQVISYQKITLADFVKWNPTVGNDCAGMWAEVNVCVGIIGTATTAKPTTTTTAGNGIQTPQPTQPGMVTNCKKFHYVAENVVCSQIISYQKITLSDFVKWNSGIGSDCRNMWAKTHVCVGV